MFTFSLKLSSSWVDLFLKVMSYLRFVLDESTADCRT